MPEILKDRNYYRMLSNRELREEAERTSNELALVLLTRTDEYSRKGYGWHGNYSAR